MSDSSLPVTVAETLEQLTSGQSSSLELTRDALSRIQDADPVLNAFVSVDSEAAMADAAAADERRAQGDDAPLLGVPFAHKDIFCTRGSPTTCASRMLGGFESPYDATVHERLRSAGAVMLGKTNMDEFAMGSSTENSCYGPTRNPWDTTRVPGGSSGGSAAAVAAGLVPVATGTDTGGSVRQPASLCGVTGLKPTYGRVSRYGMIAFASSLDQAGVFAHTAEDCATLLSVIAGFDARDSTSVDRPVDDYANVLNPALDGLRIGVPKEYLGAGVDAGVSDVISAALQEYERAGATIVDVSLPNAALGVSVYYIVAPSEASSNLSRFDGVRYGYRCDAPRDLTDLYERSRQEGFGDEVKRRILVGTYALSAGYYDAYYVKAQKVRRLIADDFAKAFADVDVLASPTSPSVAFPIGARTDDPIAMYMADVNTVGVSLAGLPALSVPAGFADGLPVGLQLVGNYFEESRLLGVAHAYQQRTDWHQRSPAEQ